MDLQGQFRMIVDMENRWKNCVYWVDRNLKYITGHFFLKSAFNDNTRQQGDQMQTQMRLQFIERIKTISWMSDDVKALAIQKVNNIQQFIAYPSSDRLNVSDAQSIATYYSGRNMTSSYFANALDFEKWNTISQWSTLGRPINHDTFVYELSPITILSVNAFYAKDNTIHIIAGVMQLPTFSADLPSYANFGGLGTVLGHELTHGFDNQGREFNQDAVLAEWWDDQTLEEFRSRAECFVDQYNQYSVMGPNGSTAVNGRLTLGENLADAGGMRTSYDTWKALRDAGQTRDTDLPGLDAFTHEQLFFIFFANLWCSSETPTGINLGDVHAPALVRIKGTTANSAAFREAFGCSVKEPTCEMW
jgi:endothelin-converting enzyme